MSRVLFITEGVPIAANYSGASARYIQNYRALHELGHEIRLVRIDDSPTLNVTHEAEAKGLVTSPPASFDEIYQQGQPPKNRWKILTQLMQPLQHYFPERKDTAALITRHLAEFSPDFLWVEGTPLAIALLHTRTRLKWVYSHTDTIHHLYAIRNRLSTPMQWLQWYTLRRAERTVFRRAPLFVTGSTSVAAWVSRLRSKPTRVIPITYDPIPPSSAPFAQTPRIVHLGSLETTANRSGLEGYLRKAHPRVRSGCSVELRIIGDASRVKPPLSDLLQEAGATLTGYALDLALALRPGDLAILPYEHDTGYRTKLPLLLAYGQVVISTRAAVAGSMLPGLEKACLIVDRVEDFAEVIIQLAGDQSRRMILSTAARQFFESHFTHLCVLDKYRTLLEDLS